MPQLHRRDPSIIGLLSASPHLSPSFSPPAAAALVSQVPTPCELGEPDHGAGTLEALDDIVTPPMSPVVRATCLASRVPSLQHSRQNSRPELHLEKGQVADMDFERLFYELIVDGVHSHPNSVGLAYNVYPDGCILITDMMKILDPNLKDGVHEWQDGKQFVKEGSKLYDQMSRN
ncbi:hypothetical protein DENSPDRAFT_881059 [Dentipellis sp. KUC8613]|nr:hypothetical protein DENSPDRAFT_881059 [Dentipellis sp. KUC8613]